MTAEPAPAEDLISLEELTERVGISVRNIRFYTSRGLVAPPLRRGRSGYYTRQHVARLQLVQELQAHGFTLAAIERYLARIPEDATAEEIALHRVTLQPFVVELPVKMSRPALAKLAGRPITEHDVERLTALGVLTKVGDRYDVVESRLTAALRLVELDVPTELILAGEEVYRRHGQAIADELSAMFRESLWPAYKSGSVTATQMVALLENFQQASIASLVESFSQAMTQARRAAAERRVT